MKLKMFAKFLVMLVVLWAIIQIGVGVSAYFITESATNEGVPLPNGAVNSAYCCALFTGLIYGLATALLPMWVARRPKSNVVVVQCQTCKHWHQTEDYCRNHDGLCASGAEARENGCNLWERMDE